MATPSEYDKTQDERLDAHDNLLNAPLDALDSQEYSYPVVGRPMTDDQWGWVTKGIGNGLLDQGGGPYSLTGRSNSTDTATLGVSNYGGGANAIVNGFYHHLSAPMKLSFPPVTSTTTYYVCLTYDPVEVDSLTGPVKVKVYTTTPPTTSGRIHVILYTLTRKPNQLLSETEMVRYRQRIAPFGYVWTREQLPPPEQNLWGQCYIVGNDRDIVYTDGDDGTTPNRWTSLFTYTYNTVDDNNTYKWPGHGTRIALAQTGNTVKLRGRVALTSGNKFSAGAGYNVMRINKARVRGWQMSFIADTSDGTARVVINADYTADPTNVSVTVQPHQPCTWVSLDGIQWDVN
jgi:hypothetical protein